jgi:hypothetical protein
VTTRVVDDPGELAALFERDRYDHIYALADLDERFWAANTWWRNGDTTMGLIGLPEGQTIVYAVSAADPRQRWRWSPSYPPRSHQHW